MSGDQAAVQLIRILPMVEAIHSEARVASNGVGGTEAADYCVSRFNQYVAKVRELTQDDILDGLALELGADDSNDRKIQQVCVASAELTGYLRQRIGVAANSGSEFSIGSIINQKEPRELSE